jgi:hypothetical protein
MPVKKNGKVGQTAAAKYIRKTSDPLQSYRYKRRKTLEDARVFLEATCLVVGDCWLSTLPKYRDGYAATKFNGKNYKAHRLMYAASIGEHPPANLVVMHTCDKPSCLNPTHLVLGTNLDNIQDRAKKGRSAFGHKNGAYTKPERVRRGTDNGAARLTPDIVRAIRLRFRPGMASVLAKEYGVSDMSIHNVVKRKTWKHID